ncbi:MAG TPA: right-handed parallel beta-helix repeat-containing protein, partial [Rectinemataceae bacterium]|nr:right-handed parallel beta-helix repeat-containing protein [Rectinemataceae bacterium]
MQPFRRSVLVATALLALGVLGYGQGGQSQPTFRVATVKDFLANIGSNRTIVLAKGDYLLSAGYSFTSTFVSWNDYDDGKELGIHNAVNLTIRGMDGAHIVSDSATAYVLGIYGGRNVTLDNLTIVRRPKAGAEVSGGTLYAESVSGLFLDRSLLDGPTTNGVELSEVRDVRITRSSIQDCSSSALSFTSSDGIEVSGCSLAKNSGYPLLYLEESDNVAFKKDKLQDNE